MEQRLSIYLCKLLRYQPELAHLRWTSTAGRR